MTHPLRLARQAQGMSLREVATRAGVDASQLSRAERGQGGLSVDSLARVADVLGLHIADALKPFMSRKEPVA